MGPLSRMKEWLLGDRGSRREVLSDLMAAYREELRAAAQLRAHAECAPYAQAAAMLRQLAEAEDRHAQALSEHIRALGGSPAGPVLAIHEGRNHWDRMTEDFRLADHKRRRYLEQAVHLSPEYPKEADLFSRIAAEEMVNRRLLEELTSKADSLAQD